MNGFASNWDTLFIALPFLTVMILGMFRLDEAIAVPKNRIPRRRTFNGLDPDGVAVLTDPDGRSSFDIGERRNLGSAARTAPEEVVLPTDL